MIFKNVYERVPLLKEPEPFSVTHGGQENHMYKVWTGMEQTDDQFLGWIVKVDDEWIFDPNPDIQDLLNESIMMDLVNFLHEIKDE